ncbi:unnamed protein product, partial [marine sediment metagenome]
KFLAKIMEAWKGGWKQSKWLQYSGWRKDEFFIGIGEQKGKSHTIAGASGHLSQRMFKSLKDRLSWYATRIDVQVTIYCPDDLKLSDVRDRCKTKNTTLIESQFNDTLYLGSRESEVFTRLYEKPIIDKYLRLEFELKGGRARTAWDALCKGETVEDVFLYYLRKSKLPDDIAQMFESYDKDATTEIMRDIQLHDNVKVLKWIESLDESMEKHMANHQIGESVKTIVRAWAKFADKLDNLS